MSNPENYPMEVINFIRECKKRGKHEFSWLFEDEIIKSKKFVLPDNGEIFNDELKGLYDLDQIRLPYETITLSFNAGRFNNGNLLVATEIKDEIIIAMFGVNDNKRWGVIPIFSSFKINQKISKEYQVYSRPIRDYGNEISEEKEQTYANFTCRVVLELLEALSCSNVSHEPIPRKKGLSGISAKNMALPMYENRRLIINANRKDSNKKDSNVVVIGGHASPREHLRRGHIRNLQDGRKIWVNSCVVGAAANGRIDKTYVIK